MDAFKHLEVWFAIGSQHLYGPETLRQVKENAEKVVNGLNSEAGLPIKLVLKPLVTTPDEITALCREANYCQSCVGLITWLHTFSPAKMWIAGLTILHKPLLQFHTQFNAEVPWDTMDMDFMNLNQTAHGGREFGFIGARMRQQHSVVAGHWQDGESHRRIAQWMRVSAAKNESQHLKVARFGDNMREVAVTEGDKVSAQIKFGFSVNTHGVGDLVKVINAISPKKIDNLVEKYEAAYSVAADLRKGGARHNSIREAARIELGLREFLTTGNFKGFTTTFEDLHGLVQLPGLAPQRLMADGYGFAGEGDWKTAALVRAMKVMASGLSGGTSFMEDYTYHLQPGNKLVLGAHMLEICPTIADGKPSLQVHPLGIGGKADPARLVFNTPAGPARNASLMDFGNRFRLLISEVDVVKPEQPMPRLPVAQAVWKCRPNFEDACAAWIYAGGAHHTGFSQVVTTAMIEDFAAIADIELAIIDTKTNVRDFKQTLRNNEVYYALRGGSVA